MLKHKPALADVLARLGDLYAREAGDRILAMMAVPSKALEDFARKHPEGFCEYPAPDDRIAFWDRLLAERACVEDDSVPAAYLSEMDQGLYGGILGGRVQFMSHPESGWISSMVPPLISDWDEFDRLRIDPGSVWFERYRRQLDTFAAGAAGKFAVSHFILIDGLNFVFELLGATRTYLSLHDRPEMVRRAVRLAFDLNVLVQETFFGCVPLLAGGTASNMAGWLPGRIVSESVDPFHMTSTACFEQWGREPVERILGCFDGGVLHLHGNGRHLLESVRTIRGLRGLYLGDDRGWPRAFDVLGRLRERAGDLPLIVEADHACFVSALREHTLSGGVLYRVAGVPSIDEANRLMAEVRSYRA